MKFLATNLEFFNKKLLCFIKFRVQGDKQLEKNKTNFETERKKIFESGLEILKLTCFKVPK